MNNCIICRQEITNNQMMVVGSKPGNFLAKKGPMHASCYKLFRIFMHRGALLPLTLFIIGVILMVVILIPGLITDDLKLIITSMTVLVVSVWISVFWYLYMYLETKKECRSREPIKKREDLSEYGADYRIAGKDFEIQEESFDYYHENIDESQFEPEDINRNEKWALAVLGLSVDFDLDQLDARFQKLSEIYQPADSNNYDTSKMNEIIKAVDVLKKVRTTV